MSFDQKGTQPGLFSVQKAEIETFNMKCPRVGCASTVATEMNATGNLPNIGAPHNRLYRCMECNHTWTLGVGGYVSI